jgi:hypothetical protein
LLKGFLSGTGIAKEYRSEKMKYATEKFLSFLAEEYDYLTKIKIFLIRIPELIAAGDINELEFQNFLEKYEVETAHFLHEKNRYKERIAKQLNIPVQQVTFNKLVQLGYREFEDKAWRVLKITNDINLLLVKISVYLRNFAKLQNEFKRLNSFLYQNDYSARGAPTSYSPGRNFHGEA